MPRLDRTVLARVPAGLGRARRAVPWWLGAPIMPIQGYRLVRSIPRFSDAEGTTGQVGAGPLRMKVVALGDSVAAGYAIDHHRSSVAGRLALRLAERHDATVDWQACARSGATAGDALDLVDPEALRDADLVFVSIGVNDVKNLHSGRRFRRELATLLDAILAAAPRAQVCLLGIPPLDHFPALPSPLADALGWRGRAFNVIGTTVVAARERTFRIEADGPIEQRMFAGDGFHPSPTLHAVFADTVMERLDRTEVDPHGR